MLTREYRSFDEYGVRDYPWSYAFLTGFNKFVFNLPVNFGAEVEVIGNIPNGSYIVASKHEEWLDSLVHHYLLGNSHLHKLARDDLFDTLWGRWFFPRSGSIAVKRVAESVKDKRFNYEAASYAMDRLAEGKPVLTFPEKTHKHQGHIGHLYVEELLALHKLAQRRGMHIPFVAASQYYQDERVGIPSLLNPLEGKVYICVKYGEPFYLGEYLREHGPERLEAKLVEAYQSNLPGYEYKNDKFDECDEQPIARVKRPHGK